MKKNKMMRVAAVMLVCVLLSTSIISGTFAKYVTAANVADTARVAKWGVTVSASGHLYEKEYNNDTPIEQNESGANIAKVVSSSTTNLVAPGTKSGEGMTFSISGVPEVAVNVSFAITSADVCLKAGTYSDVTTGNSTTDTFTLTDDYHPIVYTLKKGESTVASGTMEAIVSYFNDESSGVAGNYAPGTDLGTTFGNYTLTWEWPYDITASNDMADKADTFLGQVASGLITEENAALNANFNLAITVTQLD